MMAVLLIVLPLVGAAVVAVAPPGRARWIALATSTLVFVLSVIVAIGFPHWRDGGFGLATEIAWLSSLGVTLNMHADSVSLLLVLMTTMLMPLCMAGSFTAVTSRLREYYGWMLVLQAAMVGVFLARDLIFFYICFEFTLVPMYFLIAIYGASNRARAATKFFIFTFTGSMIALAGLVYIAWLYAEAAGEWSFDIPALTEFARTRLDAGQQAWVMLALLAGFAVKVPLFPLHTWLSLAHTEAPTAGSVVLAAVLLKLGTYGLYRFVIPMVPDAVIEYAPFVAGLAIVGILYAALICWVQHDVKRLIAYSSVSHLGFSVLGLFALNPLGLQGSVLYMLSHGLSTGALFFLVGMIYERYHTRDMDRLSGLARRMPVWAFFMVFFVLASVGLPGLNGFVSEFLCLIGAFTASPDAAVYPGVLGPWYAAVASVGMVLAAMYLLIMVGKIVFGPLREPDHPSADDGNENGPRLPADLTWREIGVLTPLAVACVYMGIQPATFTGVLERPIEQILAVYPDHVRSAQRAGSTESSALVTPVELASRREGAGGG